MAGFTVLVAADFGYKVNYELSFPYRPSIAELRERVERDIGGEASVRSPGRPFQVYRAQVFDERMEMWADLMSPSQLENFCQVYVFQRESAYAPRDAPGRIPPPVRPGGSPAHPASTHPGTAYAPAPSAAGPATSPWQQPPSAAASYPAPPPATCEPYEQSPARWAAPVEPPKLSPEQQAEQRYPDQAGHADKARAVHQWMCSRREGGSDRRGVGPDDWHDSLEKAGVCGNSSSAAADPPFTTETVSSLFDKADGDKDGVVSIREFCCFTEMYPKLLDCLYFRVKELAVEEAKADELASARRALGDMERARDDTRREAGDTAADAERARARCDDAASDLAAAKDEEQSASRERGELGPQQNEAQQRAQAARDELRRARDQERQQDAEHRGLQRGVDVAAKKVREKGADRDRAAKEIERLERALEQARRDFEKKEDELQRAQQAATDSQARADEARDPALERAVSEAQDKVEQADAEQRALAEEDAQRQKAVKDAQRGVQRLRRAQDDAEREAREVKQREAAKGQAAHRAEHAVGQQQDLIERLEQERTDRERRRADQQRTENELLQLEVRLREQRESVEQKEQHLRAAHRDFMSGTGRASPRHGGYSASTTA